MSTTLPFDPIDDWINVVYPDASLRELGKVFGVSGTAISWWRDHGVNVWRADDIAIHVLDRMPWEIWDRWNELADQASEGR